MNANNRQHRSILQTIAHRAMIERGLLPDFSAEVLAELGRIQVTCNHVWRVNPRFEGSPVVFHRQ